MAIDKVISIKTIGDECTASFSMKKETGNILMNVVHNGTKKGFCTILFHKADFAEMISEL